MADSENSVPVTVRRINGEAQVLSVTPDTQVEELRTTLGSEVPEGHAIKLFLNCAELRSGSCADAGIFQGTELTCITVKRPNIDRINEVAIWAMAQRCRLDDYFRYHLERSLAEEQTDFDIDEFVNNRDDNKCMDALAYLSDWNLEEEEWQTLFDHLEGLTSNGGREDDDNWNVEIAMATYIGQSGPPKVLALKLLPLCARALDSWDEFTAMALAISIQALCIRDQSALPCAEVMTLLLDSFAKQDWMIQGDDCDRGDATLARRAVIAVCHLAATFGDAALLRRLEAMVQCTAAREVMAPCASTRVAE